MKIKFNQLKFCIDYVACLIKHYQLLHKKEHKSYIYKVIDKKVCEKTNVEILVIQIIGKNVFLKLSPKEIAEDDEMMSGFSPLDIRTITYLACKEKFKCKNKLKVIYGKNILYRIIGQIFNRTGKKNILVIEDLNKSQTITTATQIISNNPEMIDGFSPKDAHQIGYAAGMESILDEKSYKT